MAGEEVQVERADFEQEMLAEKRRAAAHEENEDALHEEHEDALSKELLNLVPMSHYPKLQSRLSNSLEAAMLEEGGGRFVNVDGTSPGGSSQEHWQAVRSFHLCYWEQDTGYMSSPGVTRVFATTPRPVAACL
jgi:hypothetical protein